VRGRRTSGCKSTTKSCTSGFEKASYTRTALSLCRSLWVKEADRPWQPLETGHEPDTAPRCASNMLNHDGKMALWLLTTQDGQNRRPERAQNGVEQPQDGTTVHNVHGGSKPQVPTDGSKAPAGLVVLLTEPFKAFWVGSGRKYEADETGQLLVDEVEVDNIKDLTRAGCRAKRRQRSA